MLSFPGSLRVFVALEACDMRKGFEGLAGLVHTDLKEELKSGSLFVFGNRRRTRLKLLYWDGSGLWVMSKRLEKGTFSWPKDTEGKKNLLFIGDANTGQRSAIIYILIESCRRRGIDPQAYLRDVLTRLPGATNQQIPQFTPARWAVARSGKLPKAA